MLLPKKCVVHPESAIARSLFVTVSIAYAYLDVLVVSEIGLGVNVCLYDLILFHSSQPAGTAANERVNPFILFAEVASSLCPAFFIATFGTDVITKITAGPALIFSSGTSYSCHE